MAEQWEYGVVLISYDYNKQHWTDGQSSSHSIADILAPHGLNGWELINVAASYWRPVGVGGGDVDKWTAFFKRRKQS